MRFRVFKWLFDETARAYVNGDVEWSTACSAARLKVDPYWYLWYGHYDNRVVDGAVAEGQQSSELVEKTPSASPGERESAVDDLRGEQCEHGWYKCVRCEREPR